MAQRTVFASLLLAAGLALAAPGCLDAPAPRGPEGGLAVTLAALNLEGVGDVVWDLEVTSGAAGTPVVWQRRLTSSGYGDSAGSASYVGTCDAGPGASDNTVRVWVVGVYEGDISAANAGAFNSGQTSGVGAVTGTALPFQNPTALGTPLSRPAVCVEGQDAAVQFDVALMRPAQQGFFDVAVSFNDLFCSAKFDCCQDATGNGCAADGSEDIRLLFDAAGARGRTFVLGLACTAGTASGTDTRLYLSELTLDCSAPNSGTNFSAEIKLDPAAGSGNLCTAGALSGCGAVTLGGAAVDSVLYQVAAYRGVELVTSGGASAHKTYWNLALGVKSPAIALCRLRLQATADDAADPLDHVDNGVIAAGTVYPYVQWDLALDATCASEPLSFGVAGASVTTAYTATGGGAQAFAYGFGPTMPAGGFCTPTCQNGGACVAGACQCTAAFTGTSCQTPVPVCGNGLLEGSEVCDGSCPTSCSDGLACTADTLTGSAGGCDAVCSYPAITACANGDGCCPGGCTAATDADCLASCATTSYPSCKAIFQAGCSTGNGTYTVDFDGAGAGAAVSVVCDMADHGAAERGFTYRTTDSTPISQGYYHLDYLDGGASPNGCANANLRVYPVAAAQATNCGNRIWTAGELACLWGRNQNNAPVYMNYFGDGVCMNNGDPCGGTVKHHYIRYRCY